MLLCTQIFQRDFAPLAEFLEDNTIVNALSCTVNLKLRSETIYSISGSCLHISGPETGDKSLRLLSNRGDRRFLYCSIFANVSRKDYRVRPLS